MKLEELIGILIVPLIFIFLFMKIYSHEKDHLDPIIEKVKGWFTKDESAEVGDSNYDSGDYNIEFKGAEY